METTKQTTTQTPVALKARQIEYIINLFDGEFSSEFIASHRRTVFYRIANFSLTSESIVSAVLSQDDIGEIINQLDTKQYNRRLENKRRRLGNFPEK